MSDQNPPPVGPQGGPPPPAPGAPPGQGQFGSAPTGQGQFGSAPTGQGQFGSAPPPATPYGGPPPGSAPPRKGGGKKVLFSVLGVLVAIAVALGVRAAVGGGLGSLFGDKTAEAQVGDCIGNADAPAEGQTTEANRAQVVDCSSADAKFTVVGRIENKTEAEATNTSCQAFTEAQYVFWSGERGSTGYILCLADRA